MNADTFTSDTKINYQFKYFTILSMVYCTMLIISVLLPYKIINFFGYSEPGGILIFPMTYLLGGAIAETYGRKMAVRMIISSIMCLAIFNILIFIIVRIPSTPGIPHQEIFLQAFGASIRLFIGCLVGLICSDLTNVYKITKLRLFFRGEYFIQRCLWSTAISEAIFNLVTYEITYFGVMPSSKLYNLMLYSWCLKMVYSLVMVFPLLYLMKFLKKSEGIDIYDVKQDPNYIPPEAIFFTFLRTSFSEKFPPQSK